MNEASIDKAEQLLSYYEQHGADESVFPATAREYVTHGACGTDDEITTCGNCAGMWCDRCDPAHGPLCPWCHGMGYSTAAIRSPLWRQANHVLNNGGYPVQEM